MKFSLASLTALALSPALAFAQPQQPDPLGVWDAQGTFVGTLITTGQAWFQGAQLAFTRSGITDGGLFAFTSANCAGTPYVGALDQPAQLTVHNGQAFIPGRAAEITPASILYVPSGSCVNLQSPQTSWWAPAQAVPISGFQAPLCVSPRATRCQ